MGKQLTKTMQIYLAIVATIGLFALVAQFYLIIINRATSISETIIRYFSFFTILTNIIVALCATALVLRPKSGWVMFFLSPKTLTGITIYITVVGLVYNIILRQLWNPQGLQRWVDELLHTIIPILFILFWAIWVTKRELQWKDILSWLIYPFLYTIFILVRGAFSGFYPYPFIDVNKLGYNKALLNSGGLVVVFLLFSILTVVIGKIINKLHQQT